MRAGKLDKTIAILRYGETLDEYRTPVEGWTPVASVKAQVLQSSTDEFLRDYGTSGETAIVFRIRWKDGLKLSDRIVYAGENYDLKEIKELGRREGMDLRCIAVSQ